MWRKGGGNKTMIQVKGRFYFIKESELINPYQYKDKYFAKDKYGNKYELELDDYIKIGGQSK